MIEIKRSPPLSQLQLPTQTIAAGGSTLQDVLTNAELRRRANIYAGVGDQSAFGVAGVQGLGGLLSSNNPYLFGISESEQRLRSEIEQLRNKFDVTKKKLSQAQQTEQEASALNSELHETIADLQLKADLSHILARVDARAREHILENPGFANHFKQGGRCPAFVMSVDIRRSTDLMLHALGPEYFAQFISDLVGAMSEAIMADYGVVDKFTGDGLLAFFPHFYSGTDMGYRVMRVAQLCHAIFNSIYEKHWDGFHVVLDDVGLGIGVDFGEVTLMRVQDGLTVVGRPVVFATRLSNAPANNTFINGGARAELLAKYNDVVTLERLPHEIKGPGKIQTTRLVEMREFKVEEPEWVSAAAAKSKNVGAD